MFVCSRVGSLHCLTNRIGIFREGRILIFAPISIHIHMRKRRAKHRSVEDQRLGPSPLESFPLKNRNLQYQADTCLFVYSRVGSLHCLTNRIRICREGPILIPAPISIYIHMRKRRAKHRSVEDQGLGPSPTRVLFSQERWRERNSHSVVFSRWGNVAKKWWQCIVRPWAPPFSLFSAKEIMHLGFVSGVPKAFNFWESWTCVYTGSPPLIWFSNNTVFWITRFILVLSFVHLVLNHSSSYTVFCLMNSSKKTILLP